MNTQTASANLTPDECQRRIRVRGIVQGVGFRPFVWQQANELGLLGQVRNDSTGVIIECRGSQQNIEKLIKSLRETPPPRAQISDIEHWPSKIQVSEAQFIIAESVQQQEINTNISPDLATCPACLKDTLDTSNRRQGYAFTNCTHCGPRLSIVEKIPYDRGNTSMAVFTQCTDCQTEYENPENRRFHAQPNACPKCGPSLQLVDTNGQTLSGDPLSETQKLIRAGKIVAIKGIGGFQLVVDASNPEAVSNLRARKGRPDKPFALMARDVRSIEKFCDVGAKENKLLQSCAAPIVLLPIKTGGQAKHLTGIAPNQKRLGFMLPTTPLHHLLLQDFSEPLVMTSGNPSGGPQIIDNQTAVENLGTIADAFLLNDRDILNRVDDSVVQIVAGQTQPLRRARGYAPAPLQLPAGFAQSPEVLALGGELKNTFCLIKDGQAVLSQHIGDLVDAATLADFEHTLELYKGLYRHSPAVVAIDQHPQYLSSDIGRKLASEQALPIVEVQHHHAHIAACLGDNARPLEAPPVIAITLDGMGYANNGDDEEIWGGEIFLADYRKATRLARLKPTQLPGGNVAMRQPWRNLLAQLHNTFGWNDLKRQELDLAMVQELSKHPAATITKMIDQKVNCPLSSSCGRLFDAIAAAVGICNAGDISYEGQAAQELEAAIQDQDWAEAQPYPFAINKMDGLLELNPDPLWQALLEDLQQHKSTGYVSARFHRGLAKSLNDTAAQLAKAHRVNTIALSGGVMQNPRLVGELTKLLEQSGLEVLLHQQVPANDGGISLGQALVAAAQALPTEGETTTCA